MNKLMTSLAALLLLSVSACASPDETSADEASADSLTSAQSRSNSQFEDVSDPKFPLSGYYQLRNNACGMGMTPPPSVGTIWKVVSNAKGISTERAVYFDELFNQLPGFVGVAFIGGQSARAGVSTDFYGAPHIGAYKKGNRSFGHSYSVGTNLETTRTWTLTASGDLQFGFDKLGTPDADWCTFDRVSPAEAERIALERRDQ